MFIATIIATSTFLLHFMRNMIVQSYFQWITLGFGVFIIALVMVTTVTFICHKDDVKDIISFLKRFID